MRNRFLLGLWGLVLICGPAGCGGGEAAGDDDADSGDTASDVPIVDYTCIPLSEIPPNCGPYPTYDETETEMDHGWDMGEVVSNLTFTAMYDRDCDGTKEPTELNMYRDIYCHRDRIKSLVLVAGSNCGEDGSVI